MPVAPIFYWVIAHLVMCKINSTFFVYDQHAKTF